MRPYSDPRIWLAVASLVSALLAPFAVARPIDAASQRLPEHADPDRYSRVASTILDSDELMLMLLAEDEVERRVVSVSNFALDPALSNVVTKARRVTHTYHRGQSELPLSLGADVIFSSPFSDAHAQRLWRSVNIPVVALRPATSLQSVGHNLEICAKALGEQERGEVLEDWLWDSRDRIQAATKHLQAKNVLVVQSGYIVGARTLMDEMIGLAGLRNHARSLGIVGHAPISIAHLAQKPPDIVARIELRADEKRRTVAMLAEKRALAALDVKQIKLTPRYALSTSPHVLYSAIELAYKVHGASLNVPPMPDRFGRPKRNASGERGLP